MPSRLLGATFINKPVALFVKSANAVQSVYLIKTGDSLICTYMYMYIWYTKWSNNSYLKNIQFV